MAAPLWLQGLVLGCTFAYLPSYWSFKELAPGGDARPWFQRWRGWPVIAKFLFGETKLIVEAPEKLRATAQGILAVAPHGFVSFNHALFFTDCAGWFSDNVWPADRRDLGASFVFKVPFYREFLLYLGCVDASGKVARRVLDSGRSLFVYPGGEAEQLRAAPGRHIAFWKTRKGFVRLAVERGIPLIPAYSFGENELYRPLPILVGFRLWLCKSFHVALPLGVGRWWCPLLPRKRALVSVIGPPVPVRQADRGSASYDEIVDETHAKFCAALVALFDRHKAALGCADATLEII